MSVPVVVVCALALSLAAGATGQERAVDPARKGIDTLLAEHENSELGRVEAYQAFKPRFEEFAQAHRGTESEARATLWLIKNSWWLRQDGKMETTSMPLAEDLLERHPESPQLVLLTECYYVFGKAQRQELFERLLETTPHREVKAAAHFGLAKLSPARQEDGGPNPHYAALLDQYADVRWRMTTFGRIADAHLNPHSQADLAVGKQAPEIEGFDQTGKPMKLSDYRGMVVMLDFWGDW